MQILKYIIAFSLIAFMLQGCGSDISQTSTNNIDVVKTGLNNKSIELHSKISKNNVLIYWDSHPNVKFYILEYALKATGLFDSVILESNYTNYTLKDLQDDIPYIVRLTIIYNDNTIDRSHILELKINKNDYKYQIDNGPKI